MMRANWPVLPIVLGRRAYTQRKAEKFGETGRHCPLCLRGAELALALRKTKDTRLSDERVRLPLSFPFPFRWR